MRSGNRGWAGPVEAALLAAILAARAASGGFACATIDLDGSGVIDSADLNIVLGDFGCGDFTCAGDVTEDGSTTTFDLNVVLSQFGIVCDELVSCCEAHGVGGCEDPALCADFICRFDTACCDVAWDIICVQMADHYCGCSGFGPCCMGEGGPCSMEHIADCTAMGGTFMNDSQGCAKTFCITPTPPCGEPAAGHCCQPHATPGCGQAACCMEVCAVDPFCCEVAWDGICVNEGNDINCFACGCCAP